MVSPVTQNLFATSYKDDFADSDNYHRILFNSGRALQARELTQLQTIIQNEITRFGRNIFKEGAAVNPGGVTINRAYDYAKLNTAVYALPTDYNSLVNSIFTGSSSNLRAKVLEVVPAEGSDPATIYIQYLGDASSGGATERAFAAGETISNGTTTLVVQTTNTAENPATGFGVKLSVGISDFFAAGHFVYVQSQSIFLDKYFNSYTGVVGFVVSEDIVTAADNSKLYDNQGDVPNTSAPGADRYRIRLTLTKQEDVDTDAGVTFIYFARVIDSVIAESVTGLDDYNRINDLLALRTKEESGNYVVRPFRLAYTEDSDTDYLIANVSAGIAYVNGYRSARNVPTTMRIPKPTTTETIENEAVAANYGNYVVASSLVGIPNTDACEQWNLYSSTAAGGSVLGTARIRAVQEDGAGYRIYLFLIRMTGNNSFAAVRSIGTGASNYANLVLENSEAVLKDPSNNDLLFPLPNTRPSLLSDISLLVQRSYELVATNGAGSATIGPLGTGQVFANTVDWVVVNSTTGANLSSTVTITGSGTNTVTISGTGVISGTIDVLAYVNISNGSSRVKTLTETTIAGAIESDGAGTKFLSLNKADVYDVSRIRANDSNGADLSSTFLFDNGQRDNYYDRGRLIVRSGRSVPVGNVFARFRYFSVAGAGDFYSINSYSIPYTDIPSHTLADGTIVPLRDVLDFRPRINDAGTGFTGTGAAVNRLPPNTDLITLDGTYYQPRFDKMVLFENGDVSILAGQPDLNPKFAQTPINALELYKIRMGANTLNATDVGMELVEHKRYTMADISLLEKRIDRLEEFTTLNLLEASTENFSVLDSAGLQRTKAGFLADNFVDHFFSATNEPDHRASIDPRAKTLRPTVNVNNLRLKYDSSQSANVIMKGDNIYLTYEEALYLGNDIASRTENVNPFMVIRRERPIELSPASDDWKETRRVERAISGGVRLDTSQARLFNEWEWQWSGTRLADASVGTTLASTSSSNSRTSTTPITTGWGGTTTATTTTTTTTVDRVVSSETIREVVGSRVIDVAIIPFMRSRKIHFRVNGLMPYQRFFAFFDGVPVANWVRQEPFVRFATTSSDNGSRFGNATGHPEGASNLISDANGVIEGSFFIPNTNSISFRTGEREFKLLNVSINDDAESTAKAFAVYVANGVVETTEDTIRSTRHVVIASTSSSTSNTTTTTVLNPPPPPPIPVPDPPVVIIPTPPAPPVAVVPNPTPPPPPPPEAPIDPWIRIREINAREGRDVDPLAQTFMVTRSSGVFLTKVRLFFASKPGPTDNPDPVEVQIRPVVNGYPSASDIVPGSIKSLLPSQVNVVTVQTLAGVLATPTDFVFDEPVYLKPGQEYALVVLADTTAYNVYISRLEDFILGTTERRVNRQPTLGSLFKSQNARTWEPSQFEDLTFQLFIAQFNTSAGSAILENVNVPFAPLTTNPFDLDSGSRWITVSHPNHGFDSGDTVTFYGLDSATVYGGLRGSSILGQRTVSYPDQTGYMIVADSAATSSIVVGGNNVEATQNYVYNIMFPAIDLLVPTDTTISSDARVTSGKSYAGTETRFLKDVGAKSISILQNNRYPAPRMIINSVGEAAELGAGVRSATVRVNMYTTNADVSPVIDMQRASMTLIENIIDKQDSDRDAVGFNTPLVFVPETAPTGGSSTAKHITTPVTLENAAVGLKILISANRPPTSDFQLYYRIAGEGTTISTVAWTLLSPETNVPADENPSVYREYRYLAGGLGGSLPLFTKYQIKIVMRSTNSSAVPTIKDLRVIALAD